MKTETERTEKGAAEDIARLAAQDFKDHAIIKLGPNEWRCAAPGTGVSAFHVICRLGTIVVYGDIGDWVLNAYGRNADDLRHWIPGAVRSPGYLFEKIVATPDGKDCFYWLDAKESIERDAAEWDERHPAEPIGEHEEVIDEIERNPYRQVLANISDDPYEGHPTYTTLYEAWSDAGLCDLEGMGIGRTPRTYWLLEALRCFDRLERASREAVPVAALSTTAGT